MSLSMFLDLFGFLKWQAYGAAVALLLVLTILAAIWEDDEL